MSVGVAGPGRLDAKFGPGRREVRAGSAGSWGRVSGKLGPGRREARAGSGAAAYGVAQGLLGVEALGSGLLDEGE
ncbi:hypothetical protein, partial [Nocardioides salarius]|uniref:hypothetical protein n=1 Tax=Nocardioides salarius TaxID=374513 RepID=UPI0030F9E7DA